MAIASPISQDTLFQRDSTALEAQLGTQTVICSAESGKFCDVNAVGSNIWTLLEQPQSVSAVVSSLCERYAVDEATCLRDIEPFLATLEDAGFITRLDGKDTSESA